MRKWRAVMDGSEIGFAYGEFKTGDSVSIGETRYAVESVSDGDDHSRSLIVTETQKKGTPDRDVLIGTVVREGEVREGGVTAPEVAEVLVAEGYEFSAEDAARALAELAEQGSIAENETMSVPTRYQGV